MSSFFKRAARQEPSTDEENDDTIDPELRLRTVRTAASAIAESIKSEQRAERRKTKTQRRSRFFRKPLSPQEEKKPEPPQPPPTPSATVSAPSTTIPGKRRNVYINYPVPTKELDSHGEPIVRYVRNKVRTTKYTLITFIPKNLYEQFRRVANLFFLTLVVLQLFPIFGAAAGSIAVLPLAFILTVTAIKDGVEDYRRGVLDEEVNTSAATKLGGGWRNVNQHTDPRSWFEKMLGLSPPGKVSKGVRRLRDKEASQAGNRLGTLKRAGAEDLGSISSRGGGDSSSVRRLEDIQSMDSHSYPPNSIDASKTSLSESVTMAAGTSSAKPSSSMDIQKFGTFSQYQQSVHSHSTVGVVDWTKHTSSSAHWERTLWKKLEVGDIVLLKDDDQVPADIVVLSTSDPDGLCYLETKNLDGETNLKPRRALKATSSISSEEDIVRSSFYLDSEPPHQNLYLYHGVIRYTDPSSGEQKTEPVSIDELLLRGCAIRNTGWIIGLVVFTGADTKIMLNGGETPSKRSKIEKETNFNVIVNFLLLTAMCTISAIFNGLQDAKQGTSADFFEQDSQPTSSPIINAVITFVSCLIAFQNIVPISLYISIEIVKTIQAYFISQDIEMYYEPFDTPCVPKTWNISDDLGQIEYVFSDKTGTLTQNIMEFQKCSINGVAYGEGVTEAQRGAATREGKGDQMDPAELNQRLDALKNQMLATMERSFKNRYCQTDRVTLVSPKLAEDLTDRSGEQRQHIMAFFRALALCHSVLADKPDPHNEPFRVNYKAESPDEAALVAAARDVGFPFVNKTKENLEIEVMGQVERYTLLRVLEFNSTRKRMSVIIRCPDGRLILYCKGADSVIYARLAKDHDPFLKEQTQKDMEAFANGGLRTLCISYRYIEEAEYLSWSLIYDKAASSIENREEAVERANEAIEKDLRVLGATALEDKLQEGVPEAIELLHRAGIKLWILTGDKPQTAIEIAYSCNLLKHDMDLMILSADNPAAAKAQMEAGLNKIASVLGPPSWDPRKRGFLPNAKASFAVVIDGDTLRHALSPELKTLFLNLGTQCETVVCCRVSPAQKALTVKLVKDGRDAMTLSIGDGANDVAMIQEANIGCGLFGLEGSQAAMSADYAFGQFRFLTKLLVVHGRWSYQRVADMHSNFFYKNVIWTFALFWFLPFCSFDATYLYHFTFILLCNLLFTSLPVIILGAFDQDLNAKAALAFPQLYVRGIRGLEYTRTKFWLYMFDGLYQSGVVYFITYSVWTTSLDYSWTGKTLDSLADFGTTVAVAAIFAANSFVGLNTHYWTVITWIVVFGSSIVMLLWIVIFSFFFSSDFIDEVVILFGNIQFWSTVLISVLIALAPRFVAKFWSTVYDPLDKDIIRERWVLGNLKDELGIRHRSTKKNKNRRPDDGERGQEITPMIQEQHSRSLSELTPYEPAALTPQLGPSPLALTPLTGAPRELAQLTHDQDSDYVLVQAPRALTPASPRDNVHLSPRRTSQQMVAPPSPHPSYYSVSELPPPSPMPQAKYRLPSGEITTSPPPPSRRGSVATTRANSIRGGAGPSGSASNPTSPMPTNQPLSPILLSSVPEQEHPSQAPSSIAGHSEWLTRRLSARSTGGDGSRGAGRLSPNAGEFEMRVRSPVGDVYSGGSGGGGGGYAYGHVGGGSSSGYGHVGSASGSAPPVAYRGVGGGHRGEPSAASSVASFRTASEFSDGEDGEEDGDLSLSSPTRSLSNYQHQQQPHSPHLQQQQQQYQQSHYQQTVLQPGQSPQLRQHQPHESIDVSDFRRHSRQSAEVEDDDDDTGTVRDDHHQAPARASSAMDWNGGYAV